MQRFIVFGLAVLLMLGPTQGGVGQRGPTSNAFTADAPPRVRMDADVGAKMGASEPLVTIIETADFQCPFSARVAPTMRRIVSEHPDEVRLVFRHNPLPFHVRAHEAAQASLEALRQGGLRAFWDMHDRLFANLTALERVDLARYATEIGLDGRALTSALERGDHRATVEADMAEANRAGLRGTPSFLINGRVVRGAQPYEAFDGIVRDELARARRALQDGVPRAGLYALAMRGAVEADTPTPSAGSPTPAPVGEVRYRIPPVERQEPRRGGRRPLVTIVEYGDYQCPFCARAASTMTTLLERFGDDVQLVFRHNPLAFHVHARLAAEIALESHAQRGERGFWQVHDALLALESIDPQRIRDVAREAGMSMPRLERAIAQGTHVPRISADQETAVRFGATGTPSFFINGRLVPGAQPVDVFARIIEDEIRLARERIAAGVPRSRVSADITAVGLDRVARTAPSEPAPEVERRVVTVPADSASRGPANARVTIQIFSDFECPFCVRVVPTLETLDQRFAGQIRFVWRDFPLPFHPSAHIAAEIGREVRRQAGDGGFWKYHDAVFRRSAQTLSRDVLLDLAASVPGVDRAEVARALDDGRHRARVDADIEAAGGAAIRGTPSFLVGDRIVRGAQSIEVFERTVREVLGTNAP